MGKSWSAGCMFDGGVRRGPEHTPRVVDDFVRADAHCVWMWMCMYYVAKRVSSAQDNCPGK